MVSYKITSDFNVKPINFAYACTYIYIVCTVHMYIKCMYERRSYVLMYVCTYFPLLSCFLKAHCKFPTMYVYFFIDD